MSSSDDATISYQHLEIDSDRETGESVSEASASDASDRGDEAYLFEPDFAEGDDEPVQPVVQQDPVDHPVCECGHCNFEAQAEHSTRVCCAQLAADYERTPLPEGLDCYVQHPDFAAVCLHLAVLDVAWLTYKQQYNEPYDEGATPKRNRHVAYRQFVRWTYGYLGRTVRVPIPSCVLNAIKNQFPG